LQIVWVVYKPATKGMEVSLPLKGCTFRELTRLTILVPQAQQPGVVRAWVNINFCPNRLQAMTYSQLNIMLDSSPVGLLNELTALWLAEKGLVLERQAV
jgi:hypothetical protein